MIEETEAHDSASAPLLRWALVQDGRVFTVIEQAEEPEAAALGMTVLPLEAGSAVSSGYTWDGAEFREPPAPPTPPRHITRLAFLQRFLDSEAIAIDMASQGATLQAASMRRYMQLVNAATYIDLDRPDTRAGVIALESVGLLNEGRAAQILGAPLSPGEEFNGGDA